MDDKKIKFEKVSDHFRRLPDELLLLIFNKMADLKTLCHYSMVSKRFDSVISQIRSVSVKLLCNRACSLDEFQFFWKKFIEQSLPKVKLPMFLQKFRFLESIYCDYTCSRNVDNSSLLKWKVNYRNGTGMIDSFASILPISVHKTNEFVPDQELMTMEYSTSFIKSRFKDCSRLSLVCFSESSLFLHMLIKHHATLRCLTVTDSGKQGKMVIRDERLFNIKSCPRQDLKFTVFKAAWVPELHLPLSGYVMKGVCLLIMKDPKESDARDSNREDDDIMAWDFDEEEKLLGEAIKEIFKNHSDKIFSPRS